MAKQWLLVRFEANWADELNICGFSFFEKKAWENVEVAINNHTYPYEMSVGTNQFIEFRNAKALLKHYTITPIMGDEKDIISKVFEIEYSWGEFKAPWENWDTVDWEWEDEDENH